MTKCLAITRGGWGQVWTFESREAADRHPLIQYGDAILEGHADLADSYPPHRLPAVALRVLGDARQAQDVQQRVNDRESALSQERRIALVVGELWDGLVRMAKEPPAQPARICELIVQDRDLYDRSQPPERTTDMAKAAAAAPKAEKAPKEPKVAAEKKIAGHPVTAKIVFGKDKAGVEYGAKNNPKREGSRSHGAFGLYKSGMTLQKAVDAGVTVGDIRWDLSHGFIAIDNG